MGGGGHKEILPRKHLVRDNKEVETKRTARGEIIRAKRNVLPVFSKRVPLYAMAEE